MKPLTYNFHKKDRFTGELRYLDGRYVLTIDCAKDLTAEELSTLDTVWQTMTGLMDRRGQHTDDDWMPSGERPRLWMSGNANHTECLCLKSVRILEPRQSPSIPKPVNTRRQDALSAAHKILAISNSSPASCGSCETALFLFLQIIQANSTRT